MYSSAFRTLLKLLIRYLKGLIFSRKTTKKVIFDVHQKYLVYVLKNNKNFKKSISNLEELPTKSLPIKKLTVLCINEMTFKLKYSNTTKIWKNKEQRIQKLHQKSISCWKKKIFLICRQHQVQTTAEKKTTQQVQKKVVSGRNLNLENKKKNSSFESEMKLNNPQFSKQEL